MLLAWCTLHNITNTTLGVHAKSILCVNVCRPFTMRELLIILMHFLVLASSTYNSLEERERTHSSVHRATISPLQNMPLSLTIPAGGAFPLCSDLATIHAGRAEACLTRLFWRRTNHRRIHHLDVNCKFCGRGFRKRKIGTPYVRQQGRLLGQRHDGDGHFRRCFNGGMGGWERHYGNRLIWLACRIIQTPRS